MINALLRLSCALIGLLSEKVAERNYYKASYLNCYIYIWIIIPLVTIRCCVRWINGDWNIFFAYAPSRINKNIHMTAIKFVMIAFLIQQLTLFFFSLLRGGLQGVAIFALVRFCVTLFLVVGVPPVQALFRLFRALARIMNRVGPCDEVEMDLHDPPPSSGDPLLADSTDFGSAGVCFIGFFNNALIFSFG